MQLKSVKASGQKAFDDINSITDRISKLELNDNVYRANYQTCTANLQKIENIIGNTDKSMTEMGLLIDNLELQKAAKLDIRQFKFGIEETVLKLSYEVEDWFNQFKATENFIEKFMPITTLNMLSDWLRSILRTDQLKLFNEYEAFAYEKIYNKLLSDEGTTDLKLLSEKLKDHARTGNHVEKSDEEDSEPSPVKK